MEKFQKTINKNMLGRLDITSHGKSFGLFVDKKHLQGHGTRDVGGNYGEFL